MWLYTFHSACARILRREIDRIPPFNASFTIVDESDRAALIRDIAEECHVDTKEVKPSQIGDLISMYKNAEEDETVFENRRFLSTKTMRQICSIYRKTMEKSNLLDFDDLLLFTVKLLQNEPDIAEKYRRRFRHILVDEYQDTNHIQYMFLKALAAPSGNICATGDPDQAIYGWRGADINNILNFENDFENSKVVTLSRNFRSTNSILRVANKLIQVNTRRYHKELHSDLGEGERPSVIVALKESEEAKCVIDRFRGMVVSGYADYGECAILYRVNAQSRPFEEVCRAYGVPYTIVGAVEFFKRKVIKDLIAYLKLLVNPSDSISLFRIINTPTRGIGPTTVDKIKQYSNATGLSPLEILSDRGVIQGFGKRAGAALEGFLSLFKRISQRPQKPVAELLQYVVEETAYRRQYASSHDPSDLEALENIDALIRDAAEFDAEQGGELREYLEKVALVSDVDSMEEGRGALTLLTLHSAKGLEFPHVAIVGLEKGLLPHERSKGDEAIEEERRLFYVGITRAKKSLAVSFSRKRWMMGAEKDCEPSPFLYEAGLLSARESAMTPGYVRGSTRPLFDINKFTESVSSVVRRSVKAQENVTSDVPDKPNGADEIVVFDAGDIIDHPQFGPGRIEEISSRGPGGRMKIFFRHYGVRVFQYDIAVKSLVLKRKK
ncbi:MAG: DNA helicase PcrA [Planctomycetota bacterium]